MRSYFSRRGINVVEVGRENGKILLIADLRIKPTPSISKPTPQDTAMKQHIEELRKRGATEEEIRYSTEYRGMSMRPEYIREELKTGISMSKREYDTERAISKLKSYTIDPTRYGLPHEPYTAKQRMIYERLKELRSSVPNREKIEKMSYWDVKTAITHPIEHTLKRQYTYEKLSERMERGIQRMPESLRPIGKIGKGELMAVATLPELGYGALSATSLLVREPKKTVKMFPSGLKKTGEGIIQSFKSEPIATTSEMAFSTLLFGGIGKGFRAIRPKSKLTYAFDITHAEAELTPRGSVGFAKTAGVAKAGRNKYRVRIDTIYSNLKIENKPAVVSKSLSKVKIERVPSLFERIRGKKRVFTEEFYVTSRGETIQNAIIKKNKGYTQLIKTKNVDTTAIKAKAKGKTYLGGVVTSELFRKEAKGSLIVTTISGGQFWERGKPPSSIKGSITRTVLKSAEEGYTIEGIAKSKTSKLKLKPHKQIEHVEVAKYVTEKELQKIAKTETPTKSEAKYKLYAVTPVTKLSTKLKQKYRIIPNARIKQRTTTIQRIIPRSALKTKPKLTEITQTKQKITPKLRIKPKISQKLKIRPIPKEKTLQKQKIATYQKIKTTIPSMTPPLYTRAYASMFGFAHSTPTYTQTKRAYPSWFYREITYPISIKRLLR